MFRNANRTAAKATRLTVPTVFVLFMSGCVVVVQAGGPDHPTGNSGGGLRSSAEMGFCSPGPSFCTYREFRCHPRWRVMRFRRDHVRQPACCMAAPCPVPGPGNGRHPWQNPVNRFDVDNSSSVLPFDLLKIMNYIQANGEGPLPPRPAGKHDDYVDVNGDDQVTSADVQELKDFLDQHGPMRGSPRAGNR